MIDRYYQRFKNTIYSRTEEGKLQKKIKSKGLLEKDFELLDLNEIYLHRFNLKILLTTHQFVIDGFNLMVKIQDNLHANFAIDANGLLISFDNFRFLTRTKEELFIINEIFVDGVYNFDCQMPVIVIDIGMNVGFASIFFAAKPVVTKVYAFEPFPETFDQALLNIVLNPNQFEKILPLNIGLSDGKRADTWEYCPEWKGHCGLNSLPPKIRGSSVVQEVTVQLENAGEILNKIVQENPNTDIVLKIDCEGSEYAILETIFKAKSFSNVKIIMLEWHKHGEKKILEKLITENFKSLTFNRNIHTVGMIYGFR